MSQAQRVQDIALAVVMGDDGRFLVARRRDDAAHLPGFWEFPGGKPLPGEPLAACAVRETCEELGVTVEAQEALLPILYDYGDRIVRLHPFRCRWVQGRPQALECAEWRWVPSSEIADLHWPPANAPLIAWLAAPPPNSF